MLYIGIFRLRPLQIIKLVKPIPRSRDRFPKKRDHTAFQIFLDVRVTRVHIHYKAFCPLNCCLQCFHRILILILGVVKRNPLFFQ